MQQLGRSLLALAGCAALTAAGASCCAADQFLDESTLSSLYRSFTDSEHISVRSIMNDYTFPPLGRTNLTLHWNNERVRVPAISAPPGSQEAVDAITTASRPISNNAFQDYVKTRNEMQGEVSQGHAALNYYLSDESDYLAQQLGARWDRDLRDGQLNLALGSSLGWDAIHPLADSDTQTGHESKTTVHGSAVATQIVSPTTMLRFGVEYNIVNGLQHNPYRNVYAGGTHVPERHPEHRERRDTFLRLNQYLADRSSLKFSYRLYNDDWGITSHELGASVNQYVTHGLAATYDYRYYTQTRARFYRDEYATTNGIDGYLSGDYRMNFLNSHLFGASVRMDLSALAPRHPIVGRSALWVNWEHYFNSNNYTANILETGLDFHFQ